MSILDRFFGRGAHAITVPALDGAFRPNEALDKAAILARRDGVTALGLLGGQVCFSVGTRIEMADRDTPLAEFEHPVTVLAPTPDGGAIAGLANGDVQRFSQDGQPAGPSLSTGLPCLTAALALADGTLILANGSDDNDHDNWQRDLLEKRRSGKVVAFDPETRAVKVLADGLGWPAGLAQSGDRIVVAEAWRSRLLSLPVSGGPLTEVLGNLPGYPGALGVGGSGLWLALFAPRSQLMEFVLREDAYRAAMLAEVAPEHWIAPTFRSGRGFLEPLQAGSVKQLGVLKPWAPTRSFGMVLRMDRDFIPQESFHSRADGHRHGVTGVLEADGKLIFAAKGDGIIGEFELEDAT